MTQEDETVGAAALVLALTALVGIVIIAIALTCRIDDIEGDIDAIHLEATIEARIAEE